MALAHRLDAARLTAATAMAAVLVLTAAVVGIASPPVAATAPLEWTCLPGAAPADLDRLFASEPGGVIGADYQRATPLGDGRVLWTFQDAEVRRADGTRTFVHNIGMLQDANCFSVLIGGTAAEPLPWLFAESTTPFLHWYWPLGAEVGTDGNIYVFAAEMYERGPGYLVRTEPTSTAIAVVDSATGAVLRTTPAPNAGTALYGWSIESDDEWTYLFAQCHRQFGYDLYLYYFAHDLSCANRVTGGRVPKGQLLAAPTYWTGRGWSANPASAAPIIETAGRMVNATQFLRVNNNWMAITKVGDWWGDTIVVERSDRVVGPYTVVANIAAQPKCTVHCNTYFASWVPSANPQQLVFGLSHNRWDGIATEVYRPTFATIAAPAPRISSAQRCSLGHCD